MQITIFVLSLYIRPDRRIIKLSNLLLVPVIIGTMGGLFQYAFYDVFKDIYYFLNPILYLLLGSIIAKRYDRMDALRAIVLSGSVCSLYLIFYMFNNYGMAAFLDPREARESLSVTGFAATAVAAIILLCDKLFFGTALFPNARTWMGLLLINLLSLYVSASRTDLLVFVISLSVMLYVRFQYRKHYILLYLSFFGFILSVFFLSNPQSRFAEALLKAPEEITIQPAENVIEINENYRGHEAYMTMRTIRKGCFEERLVGQGFGATVDMGSYTPLNIRHIPIMHNGYPYILLKTGWIGMVVYILFGLLLLRLSLKGKGRYLSQDDGTFSFWKSFPIISALGLYLTNISITGIFNPESVILWISCGLSLQYKLDFDGRIRNHRKLQHETDDV